MSLTFIHDFQNKIYSSLLEDETITSIVKRIYIGAIQDGNSPFLLINISNADNLSVNKVALYTIDFQVSAYAKDTHHKILVQLSDLIIKNLTQLNTTLNEYSIDGIKVSNVLFDKAQDLVLNRLVINYKACIKKVRQHEFS